jgi:hypothetical protein
VLTNTVPCTRTKGEVGVGADGRLVGPTVGVEGIGGIEGLLLEVDASEPHIHDCAFPDLQSAKVVVFGSRSHEDGAN